MRTNQIITCYMCNNEATSSEHVPPKCFFLEKKDLPFGVEYRKNLITVPSCDEHNQNKTMDDEYLRMIICIQFNADSVAQRLFSTKIMRGFERQPHQIDLITRDQRPARINGKEAYAFSVDKNRIDKSLAQIARAIYFHHFNEKWIQRFVINTPALLSVDREDSHERNQNFQHVDNLAESLLKNAKHIGENQEIFYYQISRDLDKLLLWVRMVFYEGFVALAYSSPMIVTWPNTY